MKPVDLIGPLAALRGQRHGPDVVTCSCCMRQAATLLRSVSRRLQPSPAQVALLLHQLQQPPRQAQQAVQRPRPHHLLRLRHIQLLQLPLQQQQQHQQLQ